MNVPGPSEYDEFSRASCIRKGVLFGLALGMLVGLIWIGIAPPAGNELASIDRWSKVIIAGGVFGALIGLFWPKPAERNASKDEQKSG